MTANPPPVGPNLKNWAQATRDYLQRWLPRLQWKTTDSNPSENGIILWDEVNGYPAVSKSDTWRRISTSNIVFVTSLADLPSAVSGVITLAAETTYWFEGDIDLLGSRIVGSQDTVIIGGSSENALIKSTGLSASSALITSNYTMPIRHITLDGISNGKLLDLDASSNPDQALDWYGVNLTNTNNIGTIKGYGNFVVASMAFLSASGLTFDGTIGTVSFSGTLFVGASTGTIITLPATLTITRRFRIIYSALVAPSGTTALSVSASATIPVEGYILDTCNFSGSGTFISGVQHNDNKALFVNNRGISNSATVSNYYMINNATATTISTVSTPVKIAGTTSSDSITQRFTNTSNKAEYIGALDSTVRATAICTLTGTSNDQINIYIYKNGTQISQSKSGATMNAGGRTENVTTSAILSISTADYIEVWVENATGARNVTAVDLNVIIERAGND